MGDTVIRHDVDEAQTLTHQQTVQRIIDHWAMFDGRITEVWNCGYKQGVWA